MFKLFVWYVKNHSEDANIKIFAMSDSVENARIEYYTKSTESDIYNINNEPDEVYENSCVIVEVNYR